MHARRGSFLAALSTLLAVVVSAACSLILKDTQCATDDDCTRKGGAFAGSVCRGGACTIAASPDAAPACTSNAGCGANAICNRGSGQCVSLLSEDCTHIVGDPSSDRAIVLGSVLKMTGPDLGGSPSIQAGMELARDEITSAAGGLPDALGALPRPLVLVECDQVANPVRATRYLAESIGVASILGASNSGTTTTMATQVTIPDGVLLMSPTATSPTLTDLPDNGLVWRASPSDTFQGSVMALVYPSLEARVVAADPTASGQVRVSLATKGDAYGVGLRGVLLSTLHINGQPVAAQMTNFNSHEYPNTDEQPNYDFGPLITQIHSEHPHVVIIGGTSEGLKIIQGLEALVASEDASTSPRPLYLLSDGLVNPDLPAVIDALSADAGASLRARTLGVIPGNPGSPNFDTFRFSFVSKYGTALDPTNASFGYDSFYLVAYAILASHAAPATGADIVRGLKRITGTTGTVVKFGENYVNPAIAPLSSDGALNVEGASGPLDFDPKTGDTIANIDIEHICSNGAASAWGSSGLLYDAVKGTLVGSIVACP